MSQERPKYPFPDPTPVGGSIAGTTATTHRSADLPDWEQWQSAFYDLFRGAGSALYTDRAKRLSAYGWTHRDLREACANPSWRPWGDEQKVSAERAEAWAALVREVATYYRVGVEAAHYVRVQLMDLLFQDGWTHSQIGNHLGLTKQRVQKLLKEHSRESKRKR